MKLEERLNDIISEKEGLISELSHKIEQLEFALNSANWAWCRHIAFEETDFFKKMPYPRIEMRLEKTSDDWYRIKWVCGIVMKHFIDRNNNTLIFIPLSETHSSGGRRDFSSWIFNGKLDRPFRDGVHALEDAKHLNLPAFIICEEKNIIEPM